MNSFAWRGPSGLPTRHAILAALHVASLIDPAGSLIADARESYWHRAAGGHFGPPDFRLGEALLLDCHLAERRGDRLWLLPEVEVLLDADVDDAVSSVVALVFNVRPFDRDSELASMLEDVAPDPARREELLAALGEKFDDTLRQEIGAIGELVVIAALRDQLANLGYPELARSVRHVSLQTDRVGYDISAPRVGGGTRLVEVKSTTVLGSENAAFHVSRNELETGVRYRDWCLVVCEITDLEARRGSVRGWCGADELVTLAPVDGSSSRWESASVTVAAGNLIPGLPPASG